MVEWIVAHLGRRNRATITAYAMALVGLIGVVDYLTGYEIRVGVFYVAPVFLAVWYAGLSAGSVVAVVSGIVSVVTDFAGGRVFSHPAVALWNTAAFIGFLVVLATILDKLKLAHEALESLIQTVAHDLKSPVICVVGLVRALRGRCSGLPFDETRDRLLDQLESSGETMEKFLRDLLDGLVSDHSEPVFDEVCVDQMVQASVQQHYQSIQERGINIQLEIPDGLEAVRADPHRIRQVIDNILVNAIRHMGNRRDPMIRVEVRDDSKSVITRISDNGVGIPPEHLGKIFERFFRVQAPDSHPGTGLGLSIVKKIIDSHGGQIWVESEKGRGTTFSFALPISNREKAKCHLSQRNMAFKERLPLP